MALRAALVCALVAMLACFLTACGGESDEPVEYVPVVMIDETEGTLEGQGGAVEAASEGDAQGQEYAAPVDPSAIPDATMGGEGAPAPAPAPEAAAPEAAAPASPSSGSGGFNWPSYGKWNRLHTVVVEARIAAGDPNAKICYLTFDDGPSSRTIALLDILDAYHAPSTFFLLGSSAWIDYAGTIDARGHAVGIHTFTHDYSTIYTSESAYFNDLYAAKDAIESRVGHEVRIVRFPGGTSNGISKEYCAGIMSALTYSVPASGFQYFDWNVGSGDATYPPLDAGSIVWNVLNGAGDMQRICVLMHDSDGHETTIDAIPEIIQGLRDQGYHFGILAVDTPARAFQHGPTN